MKSLSVEYTLGLQESTSLNEVPLCRIYTWSAGKLLDALGRNQDACCGCKERA
jgi:hypothetical protein